ncbi:glutathione S-transferase 1-like [Ctenocephalides felis]|uniref:glutathione S-transferase 1-like n=1 Tax=Ctenocephalides felis TaxID=7515 RepID=UPI000E6E32BA|nr:glutathione S-transferase 1-like [Ctenocephalides felis]
MGLKLYSVSDGPPSLAVRMTLKALDIPFELVEVDFAAGAHMTEEYDRKNPQKEIPVLDDDGFFLSESNAIMQYLCDKYRPESSLYPKDPQARALVNHRLSFNLSTYYKYIMEYVMAPIFFGYERTALGLKKVHIGLRCFEEYLSRLGKKYSAGDDLTLGDIQFAAATMCLEAIGFSLENYPKVSAWYATFKKEQPQLWAIADAGMQEVRQFNANPPDLGHLNHPIHPKKIIEKK